MSKKVRYVTSRETGGGDLRYYWQPSNELRAQGWRARPLGKDLPSALVRAEELNADVDAWRRGEIPANAPVAVKIWAARKAEPPPEPKKPPQPTGRRPRDGLSGIYLVEQVEATAIKVGIAADMAGRLVQLQTGSPAPLKLLFYFRCEHAEAVRLERLMLQQFAGRRMQGEWLKVTADEALAQIADMLVAARTSGDLNAPKGL
jgi:hypothetical protein